MARIKIQLPEQFSFTTTIPVRITDINYGGHAGNDTILGLVHEARLQFLRHHGYSEIDLAGPGTIMADAGIEFKQELFYGDTVIVSVAAHDFSRVSFDISYKLEKEKDGKRVLVAAVKTGMVCFDYSQKKIAQVPEQVKQRLSSPS